MFLRKLQLRIVLGSCQEKPPMRRGQEDYHGERNNIWKRENSGAFVIGNE